MIEAIILALKALDRSAVLKKHRCRPSSISARGQKCSNKIPPRPAWYFLTYVTSCNPLRFFADHDKSLLRFLAGRPPDKRWWRTPQECVGASIAEGGHVGYGTAACLRQLHP